MTRLPSVPPSRVIAALERAHFRIVRIRGSHHFMRHEADPSRQTIVPLHRRDLPPGTLRAILRQAGLTPAEFIELLRR
jgi:predicted RNA binding protein YcfA (HicA-like mRNA interferase family)